MPNPAPNADIAGVSVSAQHVYSLSANRERKLVSAEAAGLRDRLVAELATASQRKDQFLAVLGHELRNPLAAIHAAHLQTLTGQMPGRAHEIISHQLATLVRSWTICWTPHA
jgi:signal transduction histidine kinase